MTERIRTTVSVEPDVLEIFRKMADVSGSSLSRCMGDWLADTAEGAQFVMVKMAEARARPMDVMREMHAATLGVQDEIARVMADSRAKSAQSRMGTGPRSGPVPSGVGGVAPSSNTGLNSAVGARTANKKGASKGRTG